MCLLFLCIYYVTITRPTFLLIEKNKVIRIFDYFNNTSQETYSDI